jgi:hypothetical protein
MKPFIDLILQTETATDPAAGGTRPHTHTHTHTHRSYVGRMTNNYSSVIFDAKRRRSTTRSHARTQLICRPHTATGDIDLRARAATGVRSYGSFVPRRLSASLSASTNVDTVGRLKAIGQRPATAVDERGTSNANKSDGNRTRHCNDGLHRTRANVPGIPLVHSKNFTFK